ncbi:CarboxypepD_reg-like domain-containing protein [Pustulibacterium marinum]|uniref:CarboxypepD_reg-like domain-containing protein n=1 Tax=Pustulibacterium marinum TaxID=1224947 RepID=A0A1I7GRM9_9FLAO|nr:carboxypeptidase-like regulatory domain-containing protein [Pustulibacterium marinum]SFU51098.1 CarboxypepD_reg-like domain-containing protein [Pustulibacterium marinum]
MNRILFLILINFTTVYSQNYIIADAQTKKSIPFVSIVFNSDNGLYTNENGAFELPSENADSLSISAMGYTPLKVSTSNLTDTIFLKQEIVALEDVEISSKKPSTSLIEFPVLDRLNFSSFPLDKTGAKLTAVLQPKKTLEKTTVLHSITIYFKKVRERRKYKKELKDIKTIVRVNLYQLKDSLPNEKFYQSEPFYLNSFKTDELKLNLTNEHFKLPKAGFAIELEMLGNYNLQEKIFINEKNEMKGLVRPGLAGNDNHDFQSTTYLSILKNGNITYHSLNSILNRTPNFSSIDKTLSCSIELVSY